MASAVASSRSVWVRFEADFDFMPPAAPNSCVAYRAGWTGRVPAACWEQAKARGERLGLVVARRVKAPRTRAEANAVRPDLVRQD